MTAERIIRHASRQVADLGGTPTRWKLLIAYSVIYFVWGSTYYAIRIGVNEVPPLLFAGMRFAFAGIPLVAWAAARGEAFPSLREWKSVILLASLMFVLDYGLLFWAEQHVPSGTAAIMLATIPAFMSFFEILLLRTQRLTLRLSASLLMGLGGVIVLTVRSIRIGGTPIDSGGAAALIVASLSWSFASVVSRKLALPKSKSMSSGAQMLSGGLMLGVVAGVTGEFKSFHMHAVSQEAWFALLYLIFAGSILGFTAYVWLLHHQSPTKVGTYAYVNPIVAVVLGYLLGGESLSLRMVVGMVLVLVSVVLITTAPAEKPSGAPLREQTST